ncbi:MAG: hypothetical protein QNK31_11345, partial [Porticoccus sp.]|nr:hypothetical protein [Porticoccus sp.]
MNRNRHASLTLLSAPAGYGKSTLVSCWLETLDSPTAWVSLDEYDNDLPFFMAYLLTAVNNIFPDTMTDTIALLNGAELPPIRVLINTLINELNQIETDYVLVLDDYHAIHNMDIHDVMSGLLRYPPPTLHLVITTRQDPPLDLLTLRAKSRLHEIRTLDLRFTQEEVATYMGKFLDNPLDVETIAILTKKTEGWITGIRLMRLSMRHVGQFDLKQFAQITQNHLIEEFLMSAIVDSLAPDLQECLLKTAILDRFCADLCTAVCHTDTKPATSLEGDTIINILEESNLFIIPLDTHHKWFRFHHLFQELLLRQLEKTKGEAFIASLHSQASQWYAENDLIDEALRYALLAGDTEAAIALITQHRHELMNHEKWRQLERWLKQLPPAIIEEVPDLLMAQVWIDYYFWYDIAGIPQKLDLLEDMLKSDSFDSATVNRITAEVLALRSHYLYWMNLDGATGVATAQLALEHIPPEHECVLSTAILGMAASYQLLGNKRKAIQTLKKPLANGAFQSQSANGRLLFGLCIIYYPMGDLGNLQQVANQFLRLSEEYGLTWSVSFAHYFLGIAHYEKNELIAAEKHLSLLVQEAYQHPMQNVFHSAYALALLYQAQRETKKVEQTAKFIADLASEKNNQFLLGLTDVLEAELALCQGKIVMATQWAKRYKPDQPKTIQRYFMPELTYIKVLLAGDSAAQREEATVRLTALEDHAKRIHADTLLIKTLTLQA